MTREKKVVKNILSEILPQIIILVLGLAKSRFYLDYLGTNTVGLVNLFSQIIGYLSLVEGGLGQAVIYRLYHPTSQRDYKLISKIRNGTRCIFKKVIIIILVLAVILGFIIPFLIKDNQFTLSFIVVNFLLYVISEIILYTTVFERSIYVATEKSYKINRIIKSSLILKHLFEIVLVIVFKNITIIFLFLILISIVENVIIKIVSKRDFSLLPNVKERDKSVLKDVKDLIVHKVASLIASNIDIILISKFIGLAKVLIYSTYLLYVSAIMSLTNKISRAMIGTIGNILIENTKKAYNTFIKFNNICFFMVYIVSGPFNVFINNFINLFYGGKINTSIITSTLFTIILSYNIIRIPLVTYTEGAGLFKETKVCPVLETIINLSLSIILVNYFGINGCLVGTVISLLISEYFIKPYILYKRIFNNNVIKYYKNSIKFLLIFIGQIVISVLLSRFLVADNILIFMLYLMVYTILNLLIFIIVYKILGYNYFLDILNRLKSKSNIKAS